MFEITIKAEKGLPLIAHLFQEDYLDEEHRPKHSTHGGSICFSIKPAEGKEEEARRICLSKGAIIS